MDEQGDSHAYPTLKLVEIDWNDSYGAHGWGDRKERLASLHEDGGVCKTVGYLLEETADRVTTTDSLTRDNGVGCTNTIPRFAIVRMSTLREAVE